MFERRVFIHRREYGAQRHETALAVRNRTFRRHRHVFDAHKQKGPGLLAPAQPSLTEVSNHAACGLVLAPQRPFTPHQLALGKAGAGKVFDNQSVKVGYIPIFRINQQNVAG